MPSQPVPRAVAAALILTVAAWAGLAVGPAAALDTQARQAIVIDYETGTHLLEKDADARMGPASMTKLMTAYLVFERLQSGALSLEDTLPVSEKAWRKGGSKMFVEVGERVRVEDLLRGIIVQSGNDASIVAAEGLAGSEEAFAELMTRKARELGMTGTRFQNSSGWPAEDHYSTARDMATLAIAIIRDFPEYYHFYSETEFTFADIRQSNRNPLLYRDIGADGLKTGHTEASGYGLAASARRGDRRVVLVVHGLDSQRVRAQEAERLMDWAFREWENVTLFEAGATVDEAPVWLGEAPSTPLVTATPIRLTVPRRDLDGLDARVRLIQPVPAPITRGQALGTLAIALPGGEEIVYPLHAGTDVAALGPVGRARAAVEYLIFGPGG